ncbi:MAG TPA: tRNA (N(6)-L-threonylcarbamoyladenosine(37)-C(2))-methylthiotransferase MtaB, partial [Chitinophagaceae bacterium]|nr:tRNA (N(6)-L-threonylcarbamoyladenosine(37)-C(2))-methylthiotransferase MtaB [Chitinophagaceae bacterium]
MSQKKSIAFHTLGCKLNFSETSALARQLEPEVYVRTPFQEQADIYVINTCSVTENADRECRQLIRKVKKQNPDSKVVITGCYAQLKPGEIAAMEHVDMVLGAAEKFQLPVHLQKLETAPDQKIYSCDIESVKGFESAYSLNDRTRTFLKVQDGCDYSCTFCTIPMARGHSRSDTIQGVLANVKELASSGIQEVVLTGINLGDFGKGYNGNRQRNENFFDLMKVLDENDWIPRYRISSIEPNLLTEEMIDFIAGSSHFLPHLHIPLQSGSNTVLSAMKRRYRRELFAARVEQIKQQMPHACIGADVITGFPGEDAHAFEETYRFIESVPVSYLHVFTYSERANTEAVNLS